MAHLSLICPHDKGELIIKGEEATCTVCNRTYKSIDGIWRMLTAEQEASFKPFIQDYETIRQAEGRIEQTADWYRALPNTAPSDPMAEMWQQRAHSFDMLLQKVINPQETGNTSFALKILDLGAGNGWLSHRLAARSHDVVAVDLITNTADGLGCHQQYQHSFTPLQASFDNLPIPNETIDLAIFNASFHYAINFERPLKHIQQLLSPNGLIVVIDTPVYKREKSGIAMVREREALFTKQYGFPSNQLDSENFLTYRRIIQLADHLRMRYEVHHLHPYAQRLWRRSKVRLSGSREAAEFPIIVWHN